MATRKPKPTTTARGTPHQRSSKATEAQAPKRTGGASPASANTAAPPGQTAVRVRMYRQGLGDCFLLTFGPAGGRAAAAKPFHVLIDCGVILGTPKQAEKMRTVAEDLLATTGGRIDVLVATHEHWDHLSGFVQAPDVFQKIEIGDVWLAWTEDPAHPVAKKLRDRRRAAVAALARAVPRLRAMNSPTADRLAGLLGFAGIDVAASPAAATGTSGQTTAAALDYLAGRVRQPKYCRPGQDPIALPGVPGVRVYVLGPPEDEALLKRSDPTKAGKEVYDFAFDFAFEEGFLTALDREGGDGLEPADTLDERERAERGRPFDAGYRVPEADAAAHAFFRDHYGFPADAAHPGAAAGDADDDLAYRRIESDWLEAAGGLALKLDSDTNNTSLALAIELTATGKVLLFPADAQVGNWLSWAGVKWPRTGDPADPGTVTGPKLLARTVVYKVGHHASHNATLRAQGLELMRSPDLVALIPVDERIARDKKHWDMPYAPLLTRLTDLTRGRVLRADKGAPAYGDKPATATRAEWDAFRKAVRQTDLYVEFTLSG
ncbi:MAG: hypothetical protein JWO31_2636 [Phycisphaerales bacterium]|nr:hypothetical protein [Phycisphaerales bacterium]